MFDPFKDFSTAGYLRNKFKEHDLRIVKSIEHEVFLRNMPSAIKHLEKIERIAYQDFLEVHRILFSEFYPWAGQDRAVTLPNSAVTKGDVIFSHPESARLAVDHALRIGQDIESMRTSPGEVMGLFAYGHPFLDGNGRTMLLVHCELAHRAGFSIAWHHSSKHEYLAALTNEIISPSKGMLDTYLLAFKAPPISRDDWGSNITQINGLNGLDEDNKVEGEFSNKEVAKKYSDFEAGRGYSYSDIPRTETACQLCNKTPCICGDGGSSNGNNFPNDPSGKLSM